MHILLIEDNPADFGLVEEAFKDGKLLCTLDIAEDGDIALQFLPRKGHFTGAKRPDLILLDLNLPKRDGREVLHEINSDPVLHKIPVIVLTNSDDEADVHKAYGLHANCYLTKPSCALVSPLNTSSVHLASQFGDEEHLLYRYTHSPDYMDCSCRRDHSVSKGPAT
jgi:two-component system, chemotaxis family, response regulator Rcp1